MPIAPLAPEADGCNEPPAPARGASEPAALDACEPAVAAPAPETAVFCGDDCVAAGAPPVFAALEGAVVLPALLAGCIAVRSLEHASIVTHQTQGMHRATRMRISYCTRRNSVKQCNDVVCSRAGKPLWPQRFPEKPTVRVPKTRNLAALDRLST